MRNVYLISFIILLAAACGEKPQPDSDKPSAPEAPAGLALHGNAAETSLTFQWDAVSGAKSYGWQITQDGNMVKEGSVASRNVTVRDLVKATDYRFGVCAVNDAGTSAFSWVEARTAGEIDPPAPVMAYADFMIPAAEEDGVARAFPGAEGGGMYTTGGRGGKVIHVTNLNDKGTGSLRAALGESGARTIVFDVAGIIELESLLKIERGYGDVTIAGQTAPGDGICLKNYNFTINASNVIIRFIRCRMGDERKTEDDAINAYTNKNDLEDIIIDHCSLSWSTDECGSFYGITNFTLQWSLLSESLRNSVHAKKTHGYGGIWGGANATYHHNLLAHHDSRNPRLDHDYVSTLKGPVSLVNNVIYNWGGDSTYGGESANDNNEFKKYNIINNYYKPGPATEASRKIRFLNPWTDPCDNCSGRMGTNTIVPGHFYMTGNYMDGQDAMTQDNWKGTTASAETIEKIKSSSSFSWTGTTPSVMLQSARDAYTAVLQFAGASLRRDSVDARIVKETDNGSYTYDGSNGSSKGLIDSQKDVGGWPEYKGQGSSAFPDWVGDPNAYTLDPQKRYTNLEMYLHYLVRDIVAGQTQKGTYTKL